MPRDIGQFKQEVMALVHSWDTRLNKFRNWYDLLSLKDDLAQRGLESFVSNDPRTLYNFALFLLTPPFIAHNIPAAGANPTSQEAIAVVEKLVTKAWVDLENLSYERAEQGWMHHCASLMLSTGWYSVFTAVIDGEKVADIWNPAEVYPEYDDDGLARVAHVYQISASGARRKVALNRWPVRIVANTPVQVMDYWEYNDDGFPTNTVIIGTDFAKREVPHPELKRIPVYVSPVNGLPDRGLITQNPFDWREHIGESILATNEQVFKNYNRQMTFMQQILRDTAQPRIVVRSKTKGVVNSSNWNVRGAIYELDVDESIETIAMPGIPIELTSLIQIAQSMMQRGGFAYSLFAGGEESGYAQSLVSASAQQIIDPFRKAISHLLTDIDNCWLYEMKQTGEVPMGMPEDAKFVVELKVSIPGDLIQRATTARQLDPDFDMSSTTVMELLFPEIVDPNRELILGRRDTAMKHPAMAQLDLVEALMEQADALNADGHQRQAQLYMQYANLIQQSLQSQLQPQQQQPPGVPGQANAGQP